MVYTREAQTADQYIEKFAHDHQRQYNITVATSDGLQQLIIRGAGRSLLSARELKVEIDGVLGFLSPAEKEQRRYVLIPGIFHCVRFSSIPQTF